MPDFAPKKSLAPGADGPARPSRIVSGAVIDDDARLDASVRPKRLDEYIGQKRVKENIAIAIEAARSAAKPSIMFFSMVRRASAKPRSPRSSPTNSMFPSRPALARCSIAKGDLTAILTALEKRKFSSLTKSIACRPP